MPNTEANLAEAFAGESQANQKYRAFADKAEKDGFPNVARLFRTTAEAERIHAAGHLKAQEGVGSTADNLQAAIDGEGHEFKSMYPDFLAEAEKEGNKPAVFSIKNALAVEEIHYGLYTEALNAVKSGSDLPDKKIFVCAVCGNTVYGEAPDKCPVCNALKGKFSEVI